MSPSTSLRAGTRWLSPSRKDRQGKPPLRSLRLCVSDFSSLHTVEKMYGSQQKWRALALAELAAIAALVLLIVLMRIYP